MSVRWEEIHSVAVFRALYLGDMLCCVPALRSLRQAAPHARISLIGLPWAAEFVSRIPQYVDEFIEFPGYPGLPEQAVHPRDVVDFLSRMQGSCYDLAIQLHGSGWHVNDAVQLMGARRTAGFYQVGDDCVDPTTFMLYPAQGSEIARNLALMQFLGAPPVSDQLEMVVTCADRTRLALLMEPHPIGDNEFVCIHAGSKWQSRRWPAEHFAAVANGLSERGYEIVLTGGPGERDLVAQVSAQIHRPHTNLCGLTDLGSLAAAVQAARLVVTNDTGVSHVAAAVRTPSVIVVLGSDPERWAPLDRFRHEAVVAPLQCRPCSHQACPEERRCGDTVSVATVLEAAIRVLKRTGVAVPPRLPSSTAGRREEQESEVANGASLCVG